jgi:hypothetical protein
VREVPTTGGREQALGHALRVLREKGCERGGDKDRRGFP